MMYPKKTNPSSTRPAAAEQEMAASPTPSPPPSMPSSASTMEDMKRRIAELESELVTTKLEAAVAQSNEEVLRLEARRLQSTIEVLTLSPVGGDENSINAPPKRSRQPNLLTPGMFRVPLADPFSRRGSLSSTSSRAKARTQLNPNSCASGLNFLADLAGVGPADNASLASSIVSTISRKKRRTLLNPASCASALDLMGLIGSASQGRTLTLERQGSDRSRTTASDSGNGNRNAEWDCIPSHEY